MAAGIKNHLPILIGILLGSFVISLVVINYYIVDRNIVREKAAVIERLDKTPAEDAAATAAAQAATAMAAEVKANEEKLALAAAAAAEAKAVADEKAATAQQKEQVSSKSYIEKMIAVKTQEVDELNSRLSAMNSSKAAKVDQAIALDKEIEKLQILMDAHKIQHTSMARQLGNARSTYEIYKLDEYRGPAANSEVEQLEKSQSLLDEKTKETESRLTTATTELDRLDREIETINAEIASVTKNRNDVDTELQSLGNRYDEVRLANRVAAKQQVPAQQAPAQQAPAQQVPAQQAPAQQVPAQQVPAQQVPAKHA